MRNLLFVLLSFTFVSVAIGSNTIKPVYINTFNSKNDIPNNTSAFTDEVRANVGRFTDNANRDFLHIPHSSELTFACWIRPENIENHGGTLIAEDDIFNFRYLSTKQIQFNLFMRKDIDTKAIVNNNVWQHLAFTLDKEGELNIYYNGDCISTDTIPNDWHKKRNSISFGEDKYKVKAKGLVDDIYIFDKALSANNLKTLYHETHIIPPIDYQLQAYLPLTKEAKNIINNDVKVVAQNISFVNDKSKEGCAHFERDSNFIDLQGFDYDQQVTLTCWVKPRNTRWLMAIAGSKDLCFRVTSKNPQLWFSVPFLHATHTQNLKVSSKDWMHVAMVVSFKHMVNFYLNGDLVHSQNIAGRSGEEDILTIGRSIWDNDFNGLMSQFALWSRALSAEEIKQVYHGKLETLKPATPKRTLLYLLLIIPAIASMYIILFKKKTQKLNTENTPAPKKNAIYLTDTFQAFDKGGNNISNEFSPTLIRLLSLIILYPVLKNKNITSTELSDILWESDSASQQKNNRSTNVHRLRKLFEKFDNLELVYQNKEWLLKYNKNLFIDIYTLNTTIESGNYQYLQNNIGLCKQLKTANFDSVIEKYELKYADILQTAYTNELKNKNYSQCIHIAKAWTSIAPLDEQAHQYLIQSLLKEKRKQEALKVFSQFKTQFHEALNQDPDFTFEDCLK